MIGTEPYFTRLWFFLFVRIVDGQISENFNSFSNFQPMRQKNGLVKNGIFKSPKYSIQEVIHLNYVC